MSLIFAGKGISNEVMHWSDAQQKKNWKWGLRFSGTNAPPMHYLVQSNRAIVIAVSIFQPISSILCAIYRTAGEITD